MNEKIVRSETEMINFGRRFGEKLQGGEVIELVGDLGSGKTTLTKGLALGLGVKKTINSPSFTIMKEYLTHSGLVLKHYDFYRLEDSGLMKNEIKESVGDSKTIVVIEWAKEVSGILPKNRIIMKIEYLTSREERKISWN